MKQIHFIIESVLAAAIVVLFVMQFKTAKREVSEQVSPDLSKSDMSVMPIAYINVDSLLLRYNFSKDMNEKLLKKQENSLATINEKGKALEKEIQEFQRKIQNQAFLTQERAQSEEARLQKQQMELQKLQQQLTDEYTREQTEMSERLKDSIYTFLQIYNKERQYQLILSNTYNDNILYSDKQYDITNEVIDLLNARYSPKE